MSNNDPKMSHSKMKPRYHLTSVLKSDKHSIPILSEVLGFFRHQITENPRFNFYENMSEGQGSTYNFLKKWLILWLNTGQNGIATVLPLTNNPLSVYDATQTHLVAQWSPIKGSRSLFVILSNCTKVLNVFGVVLRTID